MSMSLLCVRISNCSRLFLSICGLRKTVKRLIEVGKGMGPEISAPVLFTVSRMDATAVSKMRLSKAFNLMRIFCTLIQSKFLC